MTRILLFLLLCFSMSVSAQDCQYTIMEASDGTEVKTTKDYLMYESVFGGTSDFVFFSMGNADGIPVLHFQLLSKSKGFTKAYCLNDASKIYFQLNNGRIVTLINVTGEQCSGLVYDNDEKNNIRILTGSFVFTVGSMEDLEKSAVSSMKIKYVSESVNYVIRKELQSEGTTVKYYPERYFINNLKCIR
ncbi:MAG: hypothetical protein EOO45_14745 [Flavobacterium sp.]|nr:MAG: hypothetical protein EOO45_14745 [Flavobacterium sp.]